MRRLLLLVVQFPGLAEAGTKLTLEDSIKKALAGPKAEMASSDADAAEAKVAEADASRLPRVKLTAFGTLSPQIKCDTASTDCTRTDPNNFTTTGAFQFSGIFGSAQLDVTQPLYTFGKIA